MNKPIVKRGYRNGLPGEYSTVELPNGVIETVWFADDDVVPSLIIARTVPRSILDIQNEHIDSDRNRG